MENPDYVNRKRISSVYSDFMTRVTQFEDLVSMGSKLLVGFQQALVFLGRLPIDNTSTLVEHIIKAQGSRRVLSYVEAGHVNSYDNAQNVSKLHTCHLGLIDHMYKAKLVVSELECLLDDASLAVQTAKGIDEDDNYSLNYLITSSDEQKEMSLSYKPEVTDYATMMAIIYSMMKQDYTMQVRIVSSLNHTPSSGEMETYCQLWSLRPFIDDDMMHKAWKISS